MKTTRPVAPVRERSISPERKLEVARRSPVDRGAARSRGTTPGRRPGLVLLAVLSMVAPSLADIAFTLDGQTLDGPIKQIADDGTVRIGDQTVDLQGLRRIERGGVQPDDLPLRVIRLYLHDGSLIVAEKLKIADETVTFDLAEGKAMTLPLRSLRAVVFKPLSMSERGELSPAEPLASALDDPGDRRDTLYVIKDGQIITVGGALASLGADDAAFVWNDQTRKVGRDKLYGLTVAAPAVPPSVSGLARVHLKGGTQLWGKPTLADDRLTVRRSDGLELTVPWDHVVRLAVSSRRMAFLSDLKPTDVTVEPIVTDPWPPMMDAAVLGGPLAIGDRTFDRGIGVHATTRMTWRIDGDYDALAMFVGIDESVGDRGDAVVRVVGDGRELLSRRVKGGDAPLPIRLDVRGVDELQLIAEAGEGLDLGDRVNFADARLIKNE